MADSVWAFQSCVILWSCTVELFMQRAEARDKAQPSKFDFQSFHCGMRITGLRIWKEQEAGARASRARNVHEVNASVITLHSTKLILTCPCLLPTVFSAAHPVSSAAVVRRRRQCLL